MRWYNKTALVRLNIQCFSLRGGFTFRLLQLPYWQNHRWRRLKHCMFNLTSAVLLYRRLMRNVSEPELRREYRRRIMRLLKVRREPAIVFNYLLKCAIHYHHYKMAKQMACQKTEGRTPVLNSF